MNSKIFYSFVSYKDECIYIYIYKQRNTNNNVNPIKKVNLAFII